MIGRGGAQWVYHISTTIEGLSCKGGARAPGAPLVLPPMKLY